MMWKKLSSNRDPRDTLYSEVKKEFGSYFSKSGSYFESIFSRNPKFFFCSMVILMAISALLAFTLFRQHSAQVKAVKAVNPVEDGFNQILQATAELKATIRLKHVVDSITNKKALSKADSVTLDSALDRLQALKTHLK